VIGLSTNVEYWNEDVWVKYVKEDILPLYRSCLILLELERNLTYLCNGRMLSDVIKEKPTIEYIFVGGTSPPENYYRDSLAYSYYKLMGTYIKLREYYFLKAHGKEPRTQCTVNRTKVMEYIEHMEVLLKRVLNQASTLELISEQHINEAKSYSKEIADEVLKKPDMLKDIFGEVLQRASDLSVASNLYTRFIWHLRKIPKKYIKELYPEMLNQDTFKFIQDLLGLREYIVPIVEDKEIADLYTIYSYDYAVVETKSGIDGMGLTAGIYFIGGLPSNAMYPYTSIGGCICRLNTLIWGLFSYCSNELATILKEVPSPYNAWRTLCGNKRPSLFDSAYPYPKDYETLSRLEELFPAVYYGQLELILSEDGGYIYVR
jgi:hypothetical protein